MSTNDNEMRRVLAVSRRVMRGFSPSSLVAARRTAGLSRAELARRAGVGETTIRRWEQSNSSPQVDLLATVVAELGVEIADILPHLFGVVVVGIVRLHLQLGVTKAPKGLFHHCFIVLF